MNLHRWFDEVNGKLLARRQRAPLQSDASQLQRLVQTAPAALHPPVKPAQLRWGIPHTNGPLREEPFRFESPMRPGYTPHDMAYGVRWRSQDALDNDTALLMLHAAFARGFLFEKLISLSLLAQGVHVYALTLPWHMQRQPVASRYSGQYLLSADIPRVVHGCLQAEADTRALVGALRALGYRCIMVGGTSLGGNIAAQAITNVEVDGAYLLIPVVEPYVTLWQTPIGRPIKRAVQAAGYRAAEVKAAMQTITPRSLGEPLVSRTRLLLMYGRYDVFCPPSTVEELWEDWGRPPAHRFNVAHCTIVLKIPTIRRILRDWVHAIATGDVLQGSCP